jgi:rhodanese-related sulfurtransferase
MVDVQKKPKTSYQFVVWIVLAVLAAALIAGCASQPAKTTSQPSKYLAGELPESVTSKADAPPPLVVSVYNYTMMQQEAARFFALSPDGTCTPRSLFAESLVEGPENVKDFYVLDVRGADDFAAGHIEGATNIPVWELFWPENLARLPKDRPILVACNSGTSASMSTATLDLMGYDAWQLRYGMGSWQDKTPTAVWSMNAAYLQNIQGGSYPVVT